MIQWLTDSQCNLKKGSLNEPVNKSIGEWIQKIWITNITLEYNLVCLAMFVQLKAFKTWQKLNTSEPDVTDKLYIQVDLNNKKIWTGELYWSLVYYQGLSTQPVMQQAANLSRGASSAARQRECEYTVQKNRASLADTVPNCPALAAGPLTIGGSFGWRIKWVSQIWRSPLCSLFPLSLGCHLTAGPLHSPWPTRELL